MERLVREEARREGRDGAREPFNLFIDVLTEHGKKRDIQKYPNTKYNQFNSQRKVSYSKNAEKQSQNRTTPKKTNKKPKECSGKEGREAAFPAEVGREKQRLDAAAASFHKRIEKTPKNTKGGIEEKRRRSCGKEKNA